MGCGGCSPPAGTAGAQLPAQTVQGGHRPVTSWACRTGCGEGDVGGARAHPLAIRGKVLAGQLTRLVRVPLAAAPACSVRLGSADKVPPGCPVTHRPELTRSLETEGGWDVPCGTPQLSEPGLWAHPSRPALAWPGRARLGACLRPAPSVSRWQLVTRTNESMLIHRALAVGPSLSPARGDGRRGPRVLGDGVSRGTLPVGLGRAAPVPEAPSCFGLLLGSLAPGLRGVVEEGWPVDSIPTGATESPHTVVQVGRSESWAAPNQGRPLSVGKLSGGGSRFAPVSPAVGGHLWTLATTLVPALCSVWPPRLEGGS